MRCRTTIGASNMQDVFPFEYRITFEGGPFRSGTCLEKPLTFRMAKDTSLSDVLDKVQDYLQHLFDLGAVGPIMPTSLQATRVGEGLN